MSAQRRDTEGLSRRAALGLVAAGAGGAAAAACASSAPGTAPAGGASAVPKPGGTLRVGVLQDITMLDIHYRYQQHGLCYDQLTDYEPGNKPVPMLGESWEASADARSIKFNLRKGVTFHDGRDFTSEDVKWSYEHARSSTNTNLVDAQWWTTIETPDKYTVVLKSNAPRPMMFDSFFSIQIVDRASYDGKGTAVNANGTGAFKLKSWKQGVEQVYERNPGWWMKGQPYLDGIVVTVAGDQQALIARLEAGALDAVEAPTTNEYLRLVANPSFSGVLDVAAGGGPAIAVNTKIEPWTRKRARQAIFYAIDRERWVNTVLKGLGNPSVLGWPKQSSAYDEKKDASRRFDLEKARTILKEAGVGPVSGQEFVIAAGSAEDADLAQIFQADMAKLGISFTLRPADQGAKRKMQNDGSYNGFIMGGWCCHYLDPASSITKSRWTTPLQNNSGPYVSQAYIDISNRLASEGDPAKRRSLFDQYNDVFLDEAFIFPVGFGANRILMRSTVKGLVAVINGTASGWSYPGVWFAS